MGDGGARLDGLTGEMLRVKWGGGPAFERRNAGAVLQGKDGHVGGG